MRRLTFLIVIMLSGCLSSIPDADTGEAPDNPSWSSICPPGGAGDPICTASLSDPFETYNEPDIAIDPNNPNVIVIGINAGQTPGASAGLDPSAMRLVLLITEDSGETWRHVEPPYPKEGPAIVNENSAILSADASSVFDSTGTLHVTGLFIPALSDEPNAGAQHFYYAATDDLGQTWYDVSLPLFNPEGDDDRNWASLSPDGTLYTVIQRYKTPDHVVARLDENGWTSSLHEDCTNASELVFSDRPILSCHTSEGDGIDIRSYSEGLETTLAKFEPDEGFYIYNRMSSDSHMLAGFATHLIDGGPAFTGFVRWEETDDAFVYTSPHQVTNWTVFAIKEKLSIVDGWTFLAPRAIAAWQGQVHLLIEGGEEACMRGAACITGEGANGHHVAHVVFEADGTLISETILSTPAPQHVAPLAFDDFHSIVAQDDRLVMAWSQDGAVNWAMLQAT